MTLEQLRIFLAVAERGHVTRAARELNLTQSAVSAAISALEKRHGVRLFDRLGRGIALTEAGRDFIEPARQVLARAETAELVLNDLSAETRGSLRIHASQTIASYWLPPLLVALHETYPRIDISLTVGNTAQVARAVMESTADLGFIEGEITQGTLRRQVVARDELVLVMARTHPDAGRADMDAAAYRSWTWILREPGSGTRSEVETHLQHMGLAVDDLDVALELPSNEAILAAVAAGRSVTMLSRRAIGPSPEAAGLAILPVTWAPKPERPFALLTHPDRYRTRAQGALLALLQGQPHLE